MLFLSTNPIKKQYHQHNRSSELINPNPKSIDKSRSIMLSIEQKILG
jgi:hypothetical protein